MGFEDWFTDQLPALLRLATVLAGPDLAEDLVQDVAIKAGGRWSRIAELDSPGAYVRRMLVNEHLSWRRKWSRLVPHAEVPDRPAQRAAFADQHADRAQLVSELAKLPPRQRAVVALRYFEGLTDAEIAATLGCSAGTVRGYLSRALATLRVELTADREQEAIRAHRE